MCEPLGENACCKIKPCKLSSECSDLDDSAPRSFELLDNEGNLTKTREIMSEFPLDPKMAKMLIVNLEFNCSSEVLSVSAMVSENV
ncbi:hypothetical protein CARUB_v10006138mg [Capsella rubella]|uniref:Uncharacterized protein n=1 Tax=Capsella rubella TaxID=81985 RepID=R0GZK1_9BRAS|nr:hypothetical protein CARUB_v10006138mg [Capsella rubella]